MSEVTAMSVEIAKLTLRPGDVLVVKCDDILSREAHERLTAIMSEARPPDVKVLVIDRTVSLAVLSREEIEARAA